MAVALYPGSFDPVHNGHVAVIEVAAALFEEVIVAVGFNAEKPSGTFTPAQRVELIEAVTGSLGNVRVVSFSGLATAAAADHGATCLVKGVRSSADFDAEMLQANMNVISGGIPTVFVPGIGADALVSSRYVREISAAGGDVSSVVPPVVDRALLDRRSS